MDDAVAARQTVRQPQSRAEALAVIRQQVFRPGPGPELHSESASVDRPSDGPTVPRLPFLSPAASPSSG